MNRKVALLFLTLAVIGTAGCKRQRISKSDIPSLTDNSEYQFSSDILPDSISSPVLFQYLTTRSKISIKSKQQNIDNANVTFRIKKDSAIWMSANVMGFEAIRGIISTDGVRIIDRINRVYTEVPYKILANRLGFPLDYPLLQGFFLADIPEYPGQHFEISSNDGGALVKQKDEYLAIYNKIDRNTRKTIGMEAIDLIIGNRAYATYSNIRMHDHGSIPYNAEISLVPKKEPETEQIMTISLTHSSVTITDSTLSFPFQVPINYKKVF